MKLDIGPVHDFPNRRVSVVKIGHTEIGLIRWDHSFYAISTVCSHQGGPLCRGVLAPRLTGKPGDITLQDSAPVIACPWHGWEFDVATGAAIWDPSQRVRTFPIDIRAGRVLVETAPVSHPNPEYAA